jgi:hypothetical protein
LIAKHRNPCTSPELLTLFPGFHGEGRGQRCKQCGASRVLKGDESLGPTLTLWALGTAFLALSSTEICKIALYKCKGIKMNTLTLQIHSLL